MNKYNIGFIISGLRDGGAERVITNLARMYSERGYKTIVITFSRGFDEYPLPEDITRYVLNEPTFNKVGVIAMVQRYARLRKICKKEKLDVLVAFIGGAITYGILATACLPTKCVISVRNDPQTIYPGLFNRIFSKWLLSKADGAVFQTRDAQNWFPIKLQKKSTIIFNPLHPSFYDIQCSPEADLVITCGRLKRQKNQQMLIESFKDVVKEIPSARLNIYGEGPLEKELLSLVKKYSLENNVFLKGRISDVPSVLAKASLFVLSSDIEGAPNALMEAMAAGVPCVSTDCPCGGPKMLLGQNERGLLVNVNDKNGMAKAIVRVLKDQTLRERCTIASKHYSEKFREESVFTAWDNFVKEIL